MKFLNLGRNLKKSVLAVMFAVAVMFVMPATAFADDFNIIDDIMDNAGVENGIEGIENSDIDSAMDIGLPLGDFPEVAEPAVTYPLDNCYCYGICCGFCDEDCDGTCCDMCIINNCYDICCEFCYEDCDGTCCDMCTIINNADDIGFPDDPEFDLGNEFLPGTDFPADVSGEIGNGLEEGGIWDDPNGEIVDYPTGEFENPNEDVLPVIPVIPNEPVFPDDLDDNDYNDNVDNDIASEYPEYVYPPELNDEPADIDLNEEADVNHDNYNNEEGEEIITDDDLTFEEETIYDDDDLTLDETDEIPDDSNSEDLDNELSEENSDNSDEENDDEDTADDENSDDENSDDEADEADESDINDSDDEDSDNETDEEASDSEDSDDITDEDDTVDSDNTADEEEAVVSDEENSDDSDSEAMEEDDDPIINVVLPTSISVITNPYNLNVADDSGFHYSISSPEYSIKNYSNCDVSIVATVSASTTGGIVISPYDLSGNETEFTAFAYIEATNESNVYSDNYYNSANQLAFSNVAVSKEILTLADGSNGETVGYFRINGQALLPDYAQYSNEAMFNMEITFDIYPVGKSVVSDDAAEEETENVENTENIDNTEGTENVESSENVDSAEASENVENTEDSENAENTEAVENTESTGNVQNTEISENVENTETVENTESTENAENTEISENIESTEVVGNIESIENTESVQELAA